MSHSVENLQRIGVKFFLAEAPAPEKIIPVFHRWIQNGAVDGLLIDVADYAHVQQGPGVLLVAFEGNYAIDSTGDRPGVLYYRKQPIEGDLSQRLTSVCAIALRAAELLENEAGLNGAGKLRGDEVQIFANDRLLAPNDGETQTAFQPVLDGVLDRLFDGGAREICRDEDARERFNVNVKAESSASAGALLARLTA